MAMILAGKRLVVVGAGPGLGQRLAWRCAQHGASVVVAARDRKRIEALAADLRAAGYPSAAVPVDIADAGSAEPFAAAAAEAFGGVDGVVFNAFARPPLGPLVDATIAHWAAATATNLAGPLATLGAICRHFTSTRTSVVLVSSISARVPYPASGVYAATKAALHSVARSLAVELGPDGVTVNTVVPGYIEGPALDQFFAAQATARRTQSEAERRRAEEAAALRRFVTEDEVADVVAFLLSDMASGVTGQAIDVNAGQHFNS